MCVESILDFLGVFAPERNFRKKTDIAWLSHIVAGEGWIDWLGPIGKL